MISPTLKLALDVPTLRGYENSLNPARTSSAMAEVLAIDINPDADAMR
jgi:hypothetical protein